LIENEEKGAPKMKFVLFMLYMSLYKRRP